MKELVPKKHQKWWLPTNDIGKQPQIIWVHNSLYRQLESAIQKVVTPAEKERAARFYQLAHQQRFLLCRYVLRTSLAAINQCSVNDVVFLYTANKKPCFGQFHFNVTHTSDSSYIGFSGSPIGLDAEKMMSDFNAAPIVDSCFSALEKQYFTGHATPASFYKIWTRKEALLKASGEGLCNDLAGVEVLNDVIERNNTPYFLQSFLHKQTVLSIALAKEIETPALWEFQPIL